MSNHTTKERQDMIVYVMFLFVLTKLHKLSMQTQAIKFARYLTSHAHVPKNIANAGQDYLASDLLKKYTQSKIDEATYFAKHDDMFAGTLLGKTSPYHYAKYCGNCFRSSCSCSTVNTMDARLGQLYDEFDKTMDHGRTKAPHWVVNPQFEIRSAGFKKY